MRPDGMGPVRLDGADVEPAQADIDQWLADQLAAAAQAAALAANAYRVARALDYRDQLGKEQGDYIKTFGDVFDLALAQIEANRVAVGAAAVPGWTAMLAKIAAIKQSHPKP